LAKEITMSMRPVKYDPARCDAHAEKLWREFCEHREAIQRDDPAKTDEMQLYKGWSLQKIAHLQLMVFDLVKEIQELTLAMEGNRK
jgi:hypothetical protein